MPVKTPIPYAPYAKINQQILVGIRTPVESSFTPISLPTAEPATAQYLRTLTSADFPIIPANVHFLSLAQVHLVGQNIAGTAVTLFWRMLRNGIGVAIGSASIPAGNFWRLFANWQGVVVNDVLEIRLWGSAAGLNYDYNGFQIHPTRIASVEAINSHCVVSLEGFVSAPVLISPFAPGTPIFASLRIMHIDIIITSITSSTAYDCLVPRLPFGLSRLGYGDVDAPISTGVVAASTTRAGLTQMRNWMPTIIRLEVLKTW